MGRCFECRYHGGRIRRSPEHYHPVRLSAIELNAFADNTSSSGSCHSCSFSAVFLHCLDTCLIPFLRVLPQVLEQRNAELACFLHLQTASGLRWSSGVGYIIVARHTSHGICLTSRVAAQESESYDHQRAVARSVPRFSLSHAIAPPSSRGTLPSSPPPTGYYCTFLLASFWSEAEKKLFVAVAPVSKVRLIFCNTVCRVVADVFAKLLPKAVSGAVSVVWTILLLNYMTVR
jgi:hypothetical protein